MHSTSTSPIVLDPKLAHSVHSAALDTSAHHAPTACLNCNTPVPERYCSHCGQDAHHTHRLTMADMLHDIPHSIWHVDKGILYTLKTMVRRPGTTIRSYLAGKRVDHFRPLSLLFLVTGVYALLSSVLHIDMLPPKDPAMPAAVWEMQKTSVGFFTKYMSWCYVAMVPVWALFARLFLRRGSFNYAECLIIAAFITAIDNFISLLFLPVAYVYSGTPQIANFSYLVMVVVIAYSSWAYGSLLTHTSLSFVKRLWRGFLTYMLGYLTCVVVIVTLTYALNWSTFKKAMKQQLEMQKQANIAKPAVAPQSR